MELLLDFSADPFFSLDPELVSELVPESLVADPLVELVDVLPDSRLSFR